MERFDSTQALQETMMLFEEITSQHETHTKINKYLGDSKQLWANIENGHHIDSDRQLIDVRNIDRRYALNLKKWYMRIDMSDAEYDRLKKSELFQRLDDVMGSLESEIWSDGKSKTLTLERMVTLDKVTRVATVEAYGTRANYSFPLKEGEEVSVGDTVLTCIKDLIRPDYFDIGLVKEITMSNQVSGRGSKDRILLDVITDSSEAFIKLKNDLREKEIKREIQERMKVVDERQTMEMYADMDSEIKELLDELDKME